MPDIDPTAFAGWYWLPEKGWQRCCMGAWPHVVFQELQRWLEEQRCPKEYRHHAALIARMLKDGYGGMFTLIKDGVCHGLLPSFSAALAEGYDRFGLHEPFLVSEVKEPAPARFVAHARDPLAGIVLAVLPRDLNP